MNQEKRYTIAFSLIDAIGPRAFGRIRAFFPTLQEAWDAPRQEYIRAGIGEKTTDYILEAKKNVSIDSCLASLVQENISVVTLDDGQYPALLNQISDPPFILYYQGAFPKNSDILFGIVGARKASPYGIQTTHVLVRGIASKQIGIVSGLAYGIDAAAHEATLAVNGYTIGVLAGGIDRASIYPRTHKHLAERIVASGGCVLSEYPPSTQPIKRNFPLRNRIIAGISKGIVVIEAALGSGALITATCALEQNREVCAVPGPIFSPLSAGTNHLIKSGAHVVTDASDILAVLGYDVENLEKQAADLSHLSEDEKKIFFVIEQEPLHIDELISRSQLDTALVMSTLLMLEMKNLIRSHDRMQYSRV